MFVLCPHCEFLVGIDPRTGQPPAACPKCGQALETAQAEDAPAMEKGPAAPALAEVVEATPEPAPPPASTQLDPDAVIAAMAAKPRKPRTKPRVEAKPPVGKAPAPSRRKRADAPAPASVAASPETTPPAASARPAQASLATRVATWWSSRRKAQSRATPGPSPAPPSETKRKASVRPIPSLRDRAAARAAAVANTTPVPEIQALSIEDAPAFAPLAEPLHAPDPVEPARVEPVVIEPVVVEPVVVDQVPIQPAPVELVPVEPSPVASPNVEQSVVEPLVVAPAAVEHAAIPHVVESAPVAAPDVAPTTFEPAADASPVREPQRADTPDASATGIDATTVEAAEPATLPPPEPRLTQRAPAAPSFLRKRAGAASTNTQWPQFAALAGLSLLLALQLLLAQRDALAADARWRPAIDALCTAARCTVPAWREPEAFTMLSRDVRPHARAPGTLQIDASFRNDARWAQPWPRLVVTLSDIDGRVLGTRAFTAAEYLGAPPTQNTLASGQSATVRLAVVEPAPGVVAFSFDFR